jgi:hypothetical protein
MDFEEIGWEGVDWINMAQDWDEWPVLVNTVPNLQESIILRNFLAS